MAKPEGPWTPPIQEGAQNTPAPQAPQAPQVPQAPQQPIPYMPPLNWSHFKPEFSENQTKMQKHISLEQIIGWTLIDLRRMIRFKYFV